MNWYKTATYQKEWHDDFGPMQRYVYDSYEGSVHLTKTSKKCTVAVTMCHKMFGHVMWQDFWLYELNEEMQAQRTFKQVKEITQQVFDTFRTNEIPNPMLHSYLREALRHIDVVHKPTSRIPFVDWAKEQDGVSDWRSSIYGTRYPKDTDGF